MKSKKTKPAATAKTKSASSPKNAASARDLAPVKNVRGGVKKQEQAEK